ncbi:unnamed protein product [Boreogadus saida]
MLRVEQLRFVLSLVEGVPETTSPFGGGDTGDIDRALTLNWLGGVHWHHGETLQEPAWTSGGTPTNPLDSDAPQPPNLLLGPPSGGSKPAASA